MTCNWTRPAIAGRLTTLAAFLLPALALWVPSGYSYAAALLLLGAIAFAPWWLRRRAHSGTWLIAALLCAMGGMWFLLSLDSGVARMDKGLKWLLGVPCLFFLAAFAPRAQAFFAGLPIGCAGMGLLALWQTWGQGLERATGYTNAIQWGNVALLLGCLNAVQMVVFWRQRGGPWRALMGVATALALCASLLSQSRGGWLALGALIPMGLLLVWRIRRGLFGRLLVASVLLVAVLAVLLGTAPRLRERVDLAATEVMGFVEKGREDTSLGLRLAQYRLVFELIPQKPWLGWGAHGYVDEVQRRVERGELVPEMTLYPQVHNDLLDVWVKVGMGGVLLQGGLYALLLILFWPRAHRLCRHKEDTPGWRDALALRAMGSALVVAYAVFGMSQPFFNHNSGIMTFVFYVAVLWAALRGVEAQR